MSNHKHYFIEQTHDGRFAIAAKGSSRASAVLDTQQEAIKRVGELNPNDKPDVQRVRHTKAGQPERWRSAKS